ncbi:MAG: hypothetical protein KF700_07980 [Hyphomonadaceae bacterium]|nr:hypothetical protein [Hyphomonadaceae bacterium]
MKRFAIAFVLLAAACGQREPAEAPVAEAEIVFDAAGNRMTELQQGPNGQCTIDGAWCVNISDGAARVTHASAAIAIPVADEAAAGVWPHIILSGETTLIGVTTEVTTPYSGGGGQATHVTLYEIANGAARPVLTAPLAGALTIRACFSDEDVQARFEACADEYSFAGDLALDRENTDAAPRLVLTTEASTYPGRRNRAEDSSVNPPRSAADLVRWRDEGCSYRRVARREGTSYVWDAPLPACTDYLEP